MFRVLVTNLEDPPEEIRRGYNQRVARGGMEQRIEELKSDLAADDFCPKEFFATEAAFLSILMLFNLLGEFQRASGMTDYRQRGTLRVSRKAGCGAILGRVGHRSSSASTRAASASNAFTSASRVIGIVAIGVSSSWFPLCFSLGAGSQGAVADRRAHPAL
jgi:hypothetical protein